MAEGIEADERRRRMTKEEAILCLKGIKNYGRDTFTEQSDWQESLDMAIKALEQEPREGHWIDGVCSECGYIGGEEVFGGEFKYCPVCGAVMRGEHEND